MSLSNLWVLQQISRCKKSSHDLDEPLLMIKLTLSVPVNGQDGARGCLDASHRAHQSSASWTVWV